MKLQLFLISSGALRALYRSRNLSPSAHLKQNCRCSKANATAVSYSTCNLWDILCLSSNVAIINFSSVLASFRFPKMLHVAPGSTASSRVLPGAGRSSLKKGDAVDGKDTSTHQHAHPRHFFFLALPLCRHHPS